MLKCHRALKRMFDHSINILVINAGSSSLKFHLYEMPGEKMLCAGVAERIGEERSSLHYYQPQVNKGEPVLINHSFPDHLTALREIAEELQRITGESLTGKLQGGLIAHRVVHGGSYFSSATFLSAHVKERIASLSSLAPLHNPINLACIELMEKICPGIQQAAVFDTAFHQSMPAVASRYAIPAGFLEEDIRAYGFHGISHKYATAEAERYLQDPNMRLISMHLGNGCSVAAVAGSRSLDTSMGFSPLSGLVMATRCGDVDPAAVLYLMEKHGMTPDGAMEMLNHSSGLLALCGLSDMRSIHQAAREGNRDALFAEELFAYRIRKYIGAYAAVLNGVDALIFTGGIGEHASYTRAQVCANLDFLGIRIDPVRNEEQRTDLREINTREASVRILVIPANEELEIARQCAALCM